jgi:hypothetical protein
MSVVFAHFDIEADGPSPVQNSMLSLGIVFSNVKGEEIGFFLGDMEPLPGHTSDVYTMTNFWEYDENNRAELERIRNNARFEKVFSTTTHLLFFFLPKSI